MVTAVLKQSMGLLPLFPFSSGFAPCREQWHQEAMSDMGDGCSQLSGSPALCDELKPMKSFVPDYNNFPTWLVISS
eukprot:3535111-Amphidinium_carterae.1